MSFSKAWRICLEAFVRSGVSLCVVGRSPGCLSDTVSLMLPSCPLSCCPSQQGALSAAWRALHGLALGVAGSDAQISALSVNKPTVGLPNGSVVKSLPAMQETGEI